MSKEAMKLRAAAEKVVELCSERPLSLGKWFIDMSEACESLREALAEQPAQQEPVAWRELLREARDNCKASIVEEGISASRKEYRIDLEARLTAALNTSPQLAPAQRTWVGLTDEDKAEIKKQANYNWETTAGEYASKVQALTEAKLKEKNNG